MPRLARASPTMAYRTWPHQTAPKPCPTTAGQAEPCQTRPDLALASRAMPCLTSPGQAISSRAQPRPVMPCRGTPSPAAARRVMSDPTMPSLSLPERALPHLEPLIGDHEQPEQYRRRPDRHPEEEPEHAAHLHLQAVPCQAGAGHVSPRHAKPCRASASHTWPSLYLTPPCHARPNSQSTMISNFVIENLPKVGRKSPTPTSRPASERVRCRSRSLM